jgi:hypothetical protein
MFNILSHEENANHDNEIPSYPVRMALLKKASNKQMLVRMQGKRNS